MKFEEPYNKYIGKFFQTTHAPGKNVMVTFILKMHESKSDTADATMLWDAEDVRDEVSLTTFNFKVESNTDQPWMEVEQPLSYPKRMIKGLFKA
jgi:hypothetical protein